MAIIIKRIGQRDKDEEEKEQKLIRTRTQRWWFW